MADFKDCLKKDLDCFINSKEFAVPVTYHAIKNAETKEIFGIFTDTFETDSPDTDIIIQSVDPELIVKTSDIPGEKVRPGDFVEANGIEYTVKEDRPDGTGITRLGLKVR